MVFPGVPERTGSVLPRVFSVSRSILGISGVPFVLPAGRRGGRMVFPGVPGRTGSVLPRVFSVARSIVGRSGVPVDFPPEGRSGRDPSVPPKEGFFFCGLPSSGGPMIRVAAAETGPPSVRPVSGMWTSSFLRRRARLLFVIGTVTRPAVKKPLRVRLRKTTGSGVGPGSVPLSGLPRKRILLLVSIGRSRKGSVRRSGPGSKRMASEVRGRGRRRIGLSGRPLRRRNGFLPFPPCP